MNDFIKTFGHINDAININGSLISTSESLHDYKSAFNMSYRNINEIIELHNTVFKSYTISLKFDAAPNGLFLFDEFIQVAPLIFKDCPDFELKIELTLKKMDAFCLEENEFIFLNMSSFNSQFSFNNENLFKSINKQKIVNIYLPVNSFYTNGLLNIIPHSQDKTNYIQNEMNLSEIDRILKIREENCRLNSVYALPDFFYIPGVYEVELKKWLDYNLFISSLCHIANKVTDRIVVIRGSKNIEVDLTEDFNPKYSANAYSVYKFSFEEKHHSDKLEISRNIISIYMDTRDSAKKLDELFPTIEKTIRKHFSAYIQDSIKKFFTDRKEIVKESHKFATDIKGEADKLITYINTSLIGLVTAIFAGSLGLSKGERWFLLAAFCLHGIAFSLIFLFNDYFIKKKIRDILTIYDKYTVSFVVLAKEELDDIKKIYIDSSEENVKNYLKIYKKVTIALSVLMIIFMVVGAFLPNKYFTP